MEHKKLQTEVSRLQKKIFLRVYYLGLYSDARDRKPKITIVYIRSNFISLSSRSVGRQCGAGVVHHTPYIFSVRGMAFTSCSRMLTSAL